MDISEIRYRNTRLLIEEVGSMNAFAEKLGKSATQASAFAGRNPRKGVGSKIAREIEKAFGKREGWLDRPQRSTLDPMEVLEAEISDMSEAEVEELTFYIDFMKKRTRGTT